MPSSLPSHHRALVLESTDAGFQFQALPTPQPSPGSAIVHVIAVGVLSYAREIYNGQRHYPFPTPLVGGGSAIARIAAGLRLGQLVYVD